MQLKTPEQLLSGRRGEIVRAIFGVKVELSVSSSIHFPHIRASYMENVQMRLQNPPRTYGHQLWVVTERMRSWIQATAISFLWRGFGLSFTDRV